MKIYIYTYKGLTLNEIIQVFIVGFDVNPVRCLLGSGQGAVEGFRECCDPSALTANGSVLFTEDITQHSFSNKSQKGKIVPPFPKMLFSVASMKLSFYECLMTRLQ